MTGFEYKVVPAPMRGLKAKGVKGTPARFANALETVMNEHGAEGWEYQRTDTLPVEERQGLTGKATSFQNMLVFRRALDVTQADVEVAALIEDQSESPFPPVAAAPVVAEDLPAGEAAPEDANAIAPDTPQQDAKTRVSETLDAPFVFPWNKRNPVKKSAKDDDSHHAAE